MNHLKTRISVLLEDLSSHWHSFRNLKYFQGYSHIFVLGDLTHLDIFICVGIKFPVICPENNRL